MGNLLGAQRLVGGAQGSPHQGDRIGVVGFVMRRFDLPIGPMIMAVLLGRLMEAQYRRAMSISQGDASLLVTRPLSAAILGVAAVALIAPTSPP